MKWLKQRIRQRLTQRRAKLHPTQVNDLASKITQRLLLSSAFRQAKHIALYQPVKNEVATQQILDKIYALHKYAYLPVLKSERRLEFVRVEPHTVLIKNRLGILEPQGDPISLQQLDLVLAPLVAFDSQCHRIGMGGGYYDTTFRHKEQLSLLLIGLAYEFQKVFYVPHTNLDIKLDGVITEKAQYGGLKNGMDHPKTTDP